MMSRPSVAESPRPSSVGSVHSNHSSSRGGRKHQYDICVGEEVKIAVDIAIERFRLSEEQKELEFPSSLTSLERAYVHKLCASLGLNSKSAGKGANRYLTVTKKDSSRKVQSVATFSLARNSRQQISSLLHRFPVTNKERQDLQPRTERNPYNDGLSKELSKATTGRLNNGVPQIPMQRGPSELNQFRQTLPVNLKREEVVKAIMDNKVILISGETGSGKTTQVPQMILDEHHALGKPCRIFCTQPRRISALSVAERVAAERGEKIGQTVGYQIRLESRTSPKTLLTFCTNGVLLRTLMGGDAALAAVTHIIVDEIHERDRFSDFLLVVLRDSLAKYRNLKLVLMSATINIHLFANYFTGCPIVQVSGKLFDVTNYYLEDILKVTRYSNRKMDGFLKEKQQEDSKVKQLEDWCSQTISTIDKATALENADTNISSETILELEAKMMELGEEKDELEPWLIKEMDELLSQAWLTGNPDIFHQIVHLIITENVSVDYQHSQTSATPLMLASGRGFQAAVEQMLNLGANIHVRASNGWKAADWASKFNNNDIVELLQAHEVSPVVDEDEESPNKDDNLSEQEKHLLVAYQRSFDDDNVDIGLILSLIHLIHSDNRAGAILVFLPGYDEIISLRDRIFDDKRFADRNRYQVFILHSAMQTGDQRRVFKTLPPKVRKIVLSTNIAETSVTINDVVFVIDSGKVKEKSFDALTSVSMLKTNWVSRASALQRAGRAGRCMPGVCYHLFSRNRNNFLQEFQDAEILRMPLQELCLHAKLLAPPNCSIADFLAKAPEPPAYLMTRNAVHLLKQIDALDGFEELTELGHHLADLPIEPRFGKMVLYSVVLKCLDPVLTIACALAYKDPFVLPVNAALKRSAAITKRRFAANTFSDHMALLRAFQAWQRARTEGWEHSFCDKNFIRAATMEMIVGIRTQLLGQLRASGFVRARGGGDIRDLNTNSENWAVVKAALCAGMYPNVLRVDRAKRTLSSMKEDNVRFHPSSVLSPANMVGADTNAQVISKLPSDWLVYEEMSRAHRLAHVRCSTLVSPITVAIFAGPAKLPLDLVREAENGIHAGQGDCYMGTSLDPTSDSEEDDEDRDEPRKCSFKLDDWLQFRLDPEACAIVMQLRHKWHSLFFRRMRAPCKPWSPVDENVIKAVINVLTNEEQALGIQQPSGIGQRPKPMSTESLMGGGQMDSRRSSVDTEQSDDSSGDSRHTTPKARPFKFSGTPRKRDGPNWDDRSDSSVHSGSSANNSQPSSLRGSTASSPCSSPQPSSPSKSAVDYDPGANSEHPSRFFVMKAASHKILDISYHRGQWATGTYNERKINKAFNDGKKVFLVFSVHGSGHFQGYAKMMSSVGQDKAKDFTGPGLTGTFAVEWVKRGNLAFQNCQHVSNPWNDNKKVQVSKDGQEIEPVVGETLIKMWDKIPAYIPRIPATYANVKLSGHRDGQDQDKPWGHDGAKGGPFGGQWGPHQGPFPGHGYHGNHGMPQGHMYNPLYVSAGMGGGNGSPQQNMSPVMILQRGGGRGGHHHRGGGASPQSGFDPNMAFQKGQK